MIDYRIQMYLSEHNAKVRAEHLLREQQTGEFLSDLNWSDDQLRSYQGVVGAIGDRMKSVLARNPKIMKDKRLPR